MKTLAVLGASYLQKPLFQKAEEMGLRTICFAWAEGAVCRDMATKYYPVSIIDKEAICRICVQEGVDGIVSIASDVAVPTMAYVAARMHLSGNSEESARKSVNKYLMRTAFASAGVSIPRFAAVSSGDEALSAAAGLRYPLIVKPADRSGSLGVMRIESPDLLKASVDAAVEFSFCKKAVVEECITDMREVSVEGISWKGEYHLLQITDKVTTGAPHYVEVGHHQPASVSAEERGKILREVAKGVKALDIVNGATHAELMITGDGDVYVTEIGARMGGDFIGSDLVRLSTGYDYVKGVIEIALGQFSGIERSGHFANSGVWFYAPQTEWVKSTIESGDDRIVRSELQRESTIELSKSADRSGYFIYASNDGRFLPGKEI